jgi:dienelactone hydrolase
MPTPLVTNFTSGDVPIREELFSPGSGQNRSLVILAYGSDGVVDNHRGQWATMIRGYASDIAQKGFVALIADYFMRTRTSPGDIDFQRDGAAQIQVHRGEWQATIADAVNHAKTLHGVDGARIALVGFSLGSHLCLRLRNEPRYWSSFSLPSSTESARVYR